MAVWTFLAANALTNQVITELPLKQPNFTRVLNDNGTFGADIKLDDASVQALQLKTNQAIEPALTAIYCLRDNACVWGGILWGHNYDSTTATVTLRGAEFGSYMAFRFLVTTNTYTDDMSNLSASWVETAYADGGPPLTAVVSLCGIQQTVVTNAWEQHNILDLVKAFNVAVGGYDWAFDTVIDGNGNNSAQLTISAPRRGQSYVASNVVWDYPGPIMSYSVQRDGDKLMTDLYAGGAGSGAAQITTEVSKTSSYLKMQATVSNSDLTTQASLQAWAAGWMKVYGDPPPQAVKCTLTGDAFFQAGLSIGDEATLEIHDPYMNGRIPGRIMQWTCKPATDAAPEQVDVVFGAPL